MNKNFIIIAVFLFSAPLYFSQETPKTETKEKQIEGVTITKTKKAVEQKADRTIFDFSEQPNLNSGSLMEGVKKLPGLVVSDMVGMMYQGKPLEVYMDGRPMNISSSELNAFLEGMPANSVERIEIITQPGAEFPATSGGAIINIITGKSAKSYLTAVYNGGYRFSDYDKYRSRFNNSMALNSRNKWFGWQVNLGQYYRESMSNTEFDILTRNHADRLGRTYYFNSAFTFELGQDRLLLNYDINHNNNFTATTTDEFLNGISTTDFRSKTNGLRQEAVATYQKKFDDKNKKLDFKLTYNNSNSEFNQGETGNNQRLLDNSSDFNLYNFRVDYSQPLKILEEGKVSFGGLFDHQNFETKDKNITNLDYKRQTASTYLEFQAKLKKFDFIAGARAENYDISGTTLDSLSQNIKLTPFNKFKIFPNASVQYNFMKQLYLNFNYNKKISLPSVSVLNPNNNTFVSNTITTNGNPDLQPTIFDNFEVKLSAFDYAFISYNTSWVKDQIVQRISKENDLIRNEQVQINSLRTHSFNIGMPIPFMLFTKPLSEVMSFNFNPDKINFLYFYAGYQLQELPDIKTKGFWAYNLMGQFILPKDIKLVANYNYIAPKGNYYYFEIKKPFNNAFDLTLSRKFMSDRLNLSVFANDIFNQNKNGILAVSPGGNIYTSNKYDSRSFGISVNYKIPTKNKLAKEDPNLIKQNNQSDSNGGIMGQ